MHTNKIATLTLTLTLASVLGLAACAHRQPSEGDAVTKRVKARRTRPATTVASPANSDDAKVVFKSSGMPMVMMYWMSAAPRACEGFEPVGRVFDSGRGILLPGIAHLTERVNKVAAHAEIS